MINNNDVEELRQELIKLIDSFTSRSKAADLCGKKKSYISDLCNGAKMPSVKQMLKMMELLNARKC